MMRKALTKSQKIPDIGRRNIQHGKAISQNMDDYLLLILILEKDKCKSDDNLRFQFSALHSRRVFIVIFDEKSKKCCMRFHKENHIAILMTDCIFKIF